MSNLSRQFEGRRQEWEEMQRRRYARKHESGFSGAGFWYWNYPNMVGGLMSGSPIQSQTYADQGLGTSSGMGEGGTSVSGNSGGAPA